MEDTDEFAWAVKVVIKRQMRDLMEQLRERGEEVAVMTVNVEDNTCSHFGSPNGEWFISEQKNITKSFLDFCQTNGSGKKKGKQAAGTQKKKSIASLKDSSKQSASNEVPEVRVTVPKNLVGDMTEEEVANLVGRIVATHLAVQEKGDGSSSGTQFDVLVRTANHSKKDTSVPSTPTRSARKRKPTAKYMEGMSTLKKSKRLEDDDAASELGTEDDTNVIGLLSELNNTVLRKVQVSINNERNINLEDYDIEASENTEWLAVNIIHELDAISAGQLAHKKSIKVLVELEVTECKTVTVIIGRFVEGRHEDMDDSDMEYLDEGEDDIDDDDYDDDNYDDDNDDYKSADDDDENLAANMKPIREIKIEKDTGDYVEMPPKQKRKSQAGKPRHFSETRPTPCPHCDQILTGVSSMNSHIRRVHLKQKNNLCSICGKGFFTSTHRDSHFTSVHIRKCPDCNLEVREKIPWSENVTPTTPRNVQCACGTTVEIKSKYGKPKQDNNQRQRKRALSEIMPMECEECGLVLKGRSSLNSHFRRMHLRTLDHVCTVCSKGFFTKTHLESHMLSLHARRCQVCQEYVMESERWAPDVDRWTERKLTCSCGALVSIVTKLGRKRENGSDDDTQTKKRVKRESAPGARYVCGSCGKIFLKKKNAMSHTCSSKDATDTGESKVICDVCKVEFDTEAAMRDHVTKAHAIQQDEKGEFTVEGEGVIIGEMDQVVMFEDDQTAISEFTDGSKVMLDGKLVPVEQVVDSEGNVISFVIKQD